MATLYKFRSFSNPYHVRLLKENEVWFSAPEQFNDPFDCNIPLRLDECPEEWLRERMTEEALSRHPEISREEAQKIAEAELDQTGGPEQRRTLRRRQFKESVSPVTGVLSLTRHWNQDGSELLWSHYADMHKGFAVGLNEEAMLSWMRDLSGVQVGATTHDPTEGLNIRPAEVEYVDEFPTLIPCEEEAWKLIYKLVTHKSRSWSYEDEVRYLMFRFSHDLTASDLSDDDRAQTIPEDAIEEIILGVNVKDENVELTKSVLRKKDSDVDLYLARLKEDEFGLERTPLSL